MEAEQFLDNDLKGTHQVYDETGVTLITGIEHSEICRIMDEYHQAKLKLLGIANVVGQSEQLTPFKCPNCGNDWDTKKANNCECGASVRR